MLLYRPVGVKELELIAQAGWHEYPPRLPEQPIFYPVLNQGYAEQIARDWNTKDAASGYAGFVTRFELPDDYASQFAREVVGNQSHEELWVPAEDLAVLNGKIIGTISVVAYFYGSDYQGEIDPDTNLPIDLPAADAP